MVGDFPIFIGGRSHKMELLGKYTNQIRNDLELATMQLNYLSAPSKYHPGGNGNPISTEVFHGKPWETHL